MSVNQKAQAFIIHCIDFRFQKVIQEDIKKRGFDGKFDRISWPGASLDHKNVKKSALISLKLHDPDEVFIYEHEDCGAYGQDNSRKTHRANAEKLAKALVEAKPSLKVHILIATSDGIEQL